VADEPLVSLKGGLMSSSGLFSALLLPPVAVVLLRSLSALGAHLVWLQLPRLLRSFVGFQTARRVEELAGTSLGALDAHRLKGSLRTRTCQQAISTLRATAALAGFDLPWRCSVCMSRAGGSSSR
jgi:hypothetical protein